MKAIAAVALAAACASKAPDMEKSADIAPGIDLQGIDRSVAPGDDFFKFANGTWIKTTEIPADRGSFGTGEALGELTAQRTADLIAEVSKDAKRAEEPASPATGGARMRGASEDARKVGDYYASFMDEASIEQEGAAVLQPMLGRIAEIKDKKALAKALGETLRADVDVLNNTTLYTDNLFGLWVAQDLDNPKIYAAFLLQGGLGMPDREYYLEQEPRMQELREKYKIYVAALLQLSGESDSRAKAGRIFELEKRIAAAHASRLDTEDPQKGNNHWKRSDFGMKAPGMDWDAYFAGAGLKPETNFVVWQPAAFTGISQLVCDVPLETWKEYLAFHAVAHVAHLLPKAFVDARFAFYGTALSGTPQQRVRWKRAVSATDAALGEVVGKLYVEKYFPPAEKARAEEMVKNIIAAFGRRIDALPWMAPATKEKAKAKLAVLKVGVGYPDKWRDYSGLQIVRGDALGNFQRAQLFDYRLKRDWLDQPVDRGEWVMNAHLVNAVNLPAMNSLNFPAAILQPPYFDPKRAAVMDYGATGATIGHEISHSFDNAGALFDAEGRLKNWWTPDDFAHFEAAGKALAKQYDAYAPFPDLHVRGEQTLAENIADVAGLSAAFDAYRISLNGKEPAPLAGFSADQLFFLSFAQSWRGKEREQLLRQQIIVDGHSPGEYRADTVRNLDAWYPAFQVQPGQKLFLDQQARVRMW
jgi:putative endopeptidase